MTPASKAVLTFTHEQVWYMWFRNILDSKPPCFPATYWFEAVGVEA